MDFNITFRSNAYATFITNVNTLFYHVFLFEVYYELPTFLHEF